MSKKTACVILQPTGNIDLDTIRRNLGYRLGRKNNSLHIRIALYALASMTPEETLEMADRYLADAGAKIAEVV